MWSVYIVKCSDGSLYTGIARDVSKRIKQHNNGTGAKYTRGRGPVELMLVADGFSKSEASKIEAQIKKMSRDEKCLLILEPSNFLRTYND